MSRAHQAICTSEAVGPHSLRWNPGSATVGPLRVIGRVARPTFLVFEVGRIGAPGAGGPGGGDFDRDRCVALPLPPTDDWQGGREALAGAMPHWTPPASPPLRGRRGAGAEGPWMARSVGTPEPSRRQSGSPSACGDSRQPRAPRRLQARHGCGPTLCGALPRSSASKAERNQESRSGHVRRGEGSRRSALRRSDGGTTLATEKIAQSRSKRERRIPRSIRVRPPGPSRGMNWHL